jgi:hypothetical protein
VQTVKGRAGVWLPCLQCLLWLQQAWPMHALLFCRRHAFISGRALVARLSPPTERPQTRTNIPFTHVPEAPSPLHDPDSNWILLAASSNALPDHQMCSNQKRISLSLIAAPPSALIPTPTASECDPRHNTHGLQTLR